MGLDNLKRWHWALIGIVVGLLIAFAHNGVEPNYPVSISVGAFDQELGANDLPGDRPRLIDIVLHPPSNAADSAYHKSVQIVTFRHAVYDEKRRGWVYKPAALKIELPFTPAAGGDYGGSFENYMKAMASDNGNVKYRVAWWEVPKTQYELWVIGCLLVIGGAWPTILNLLVGAGFGPAKTKEKYDLSRFGKYKESAPAPASGAAMTAADKDQLSRLTENLQGGLGVGAAGNDAAPPAPAGADQPVRKLDNKPLEIAPTKSEKEDKEYKGEFYPVAHPNQKKKQGPEK
jgi:hypothetical protein